MNKKKNLLSKTVKKNYKEWFWGYVFIFPAMLGLFLFMLYPLIKGFQYSFYDVQLMSQKFIGLENYKTLLGDVHFWKALKNTVTYTLGIVVFGIPLSFIMALLVSQKLKAMSAYRMFLYIPVVTSMIAVSMVWKGLFTADGLVNQIIGVFGVEPINWLTDERYALAAVIIMSIWKGTGFNMVMFLGGLQSISNSVYEAADVEGASWSQKLFKITLPLISPTTFFIIITTVINSFQVFEQAQVLTGGGPKEATTTLVLSIYNNAFANFKAGYASAQATILFVILLIVTIIQFTMEKRWVYHGNS